MIINFISQEIRRMVANNDYLPIKSSLEDDDMPIGAMNNEERAIMSLYYIFQAELKALVKESQKMFSLKNKDRFAVEISDMNQEMDFLMKRLNNSLRRFGTEEDFYCRAGFAVVKKISVFQIKRREYAPCQN